MNIEHTTIMPFMKIIKLTPHFNGFNNICLDQLEVNVRSHLPRPDN